MSADGRDVLYEALYLHSICVFDMGGFAQYACNQIISTYRPREHRRSPRLQW